MEKNYLGGLNTKELGVLLSTGFHSKRDKEQLTKTLKKLPADSRRFFETYGTNYSGILNTGKNQVSSENAHHYRLLLNAHNPKRYSLKTSEFSKENRKENLKTNVKANNRKITRNYISSYEDELTSEYDTDTDSSDSTLESDEIEYGSDDVECYTQNYQTICIGDAVEARITKKMRESKMCVSTSTMRGTIVALHPETTILQVIEPKCVVDFLLKKRNPMSTNVYTRVKTRDVYLRKEEEDVEVTSEDESDDTKRKKTGNEKQSKPHISRENLAYSCRKMKDQREIDTFWKSIKEKFKRVFEKHRKKKTHTSDSVVLAEIKAKKLLTINELDHVKQIITRCANYNKLLNPVFTNPLRV
jgi:hypothetical protein